MVSAVTSQEDCYMFDPSPSAFCAELYVLTSSHGQNKHGCMFVCLFMWACNELVTGPASTLPLTHDSCDWLLQTPKDLYVRKEEERMNVYIISAQTHANCTHMYIVYIMPLYELSMSDTVPKMTFDLG